MNARRLILLVGAIALIAGVIAALVPVSVPGPEGGSIGCGNGIAADTSAAREADSRNPVNLPILNEVVPHTDYVTQCQSALSSRRAWAIPVAVVGLVVIAGSFFVGRRTSGVRAG
ncbi:MAG TPA: aminopeptidase [Mycobacterium sp.]|nr:aminopeptidase [Mycobacterium sp.]